MFQIYSGVNSIHVTVIGIDYTKICQINSRAVYDKKARRFPASSDRSGNLSIKVKYKPRDFQWHRCRLVLVRVVSGNRGTRALPCPPEKFEQIHYGVPSKV
jgi:hypothetical protein